VSHLAQAFVAIAALLIYQMQQSLQTVLIGKLQYFNILVTKNCNNNYSQLLRYLVWTTKQTEKTKTKSLQSTRKLDWMQIKESIGSLTHYTSTLLVDESSGVHSTADPI
jgi:hypothetical protein